MHNLPCFTCCYPEAPVQLQHWDPSYALQHTGCRVHHSAHELEMKSDEEIGQIAWIRHRAWLDKPTDKSVTCPCMIRGLLYLHFHLSCYTCNPQIICPSPASHNKFYTPKGSTHLSQRAMPRTFPLLVVLGVTPAPKGPLAGTGASCCLGVLLRIPHLSLPPHSYVCLLMLFKKKFIFLHCDWVVESQIYSSYGV